MKRNIVILYVTFWTQFGAMLTLTIRLWFWCIQMCTYVKYIHFHFPHRRERERCKFRKGNWHWLLCSVLFVLKIPILNSKGPAQDRDRKTIYILNIVMKSFAKVLFKKKNHQNIIFSFFQVNQRKTFLLQYVNR